MRFAFLSLCLIVCASAAGAQTAPPASPQVLDQVYACANITDEHQRLACYDTAVGRLHQAQTSGDMVAIDRAQAQEITRESFGFSLPSLPHLLHLQPHSGDEPTEAMNFEIARIIRRGDGTAQFNMTNGQIWHQLNHELLRYVHDGSAVTVRPMRLGGFGMAPAQGGPGMRVERVQ